MNFNPMLQSELTVCSFSHFVKLTKHKVKPVAGIDFRNGTEQKFIGLAKNNEGFRELNDFLSHHLHSGLTIEDKAPILFNSFIIYPFNPKYFDLKEYEFIGIKPTDLNKLTFSEWKKHMNCPHIIILIKSVKSGS